MRVYLDTSVVVALFCGDRHHARAVELLASEQLFVVVSDWTTLEFSSVVARFAREARFTRTEAVELLTVYRRWIGENAETILISEDDVAVATSLVSEMTFNLRGPDALHIAAALEASTSLLTFDLRMAAAAHKWGLQVIEM